MTRGESVRLFVGESSGSAYYVIAAAKSLQLHVSVQLEEVSTKDTDSDYARYEPVGISYDITTDALVRSGETIDGGSSSYAASLDDMMRYYNGDTMLVWEIANATGANNRTKGTTIASGQVTISSLAISAQDKALATYSATLTGYGSYKVGR